MVLNTRIISFAVVPRVRRQPELPYPAAAAAAAAAADVAVRISADAALGLYCMGDVLTHRVSKPFKEQPSHRACI